MSQPIPTTWVHFLGHPVVLNTFIVRPNAIFIMGKHDTEIIHNFSLQFARMTIVSFKPIIKQKENN